MILNVWASWCYECGIEMPYLRSFYAKAQGKVALVGVDVEEKHGSWPKICRESWDDLAQFL